MAKTISQKKHFETVIALNDRRYAEVAAARGEALKIKEAADAKALDLARDHQAYRDMKANELREQISSERGLYATKNEIAPLIAYVLSQTGKGQGINTAWTVAAFIIMFAVAVLVPVLTKGT